MNTQNCEKGNEMKRCARSRKNACLFHIFHGPPPNLAHTRRHHHQEKGQCQGAQVRWLKSPTTRKLGYRLPMIPENGFRMKPERGQPALINWRRPRQRQGNAKSASMLSASHEKNL